MKNGLDVIDEIEERINTEKQTRNIEGISIKGDTYLSLDPKHISELSAEKAEVAWLWEGYIAKGHLTFFSALWKAGKSTLVAHLLRNLQTGEDFAGQPVSKANVLILSEESETTWARRRIDLSLDGGIYVSPRQIKVKLSNSEWLQFIQFNLKFCLEKEIDLVIVDTISTFWPVRDCLSPPNRNLFLSPQLR